MINTIHLFPDLTKKLILLLKGLSIAEWETSTCLPGRTVKDLVSHILDASCLRRLSAQRDGYFVEPVSVNSYSNLVGFIQELNSSWISATKRISPKILISLLEQAETELYEFLRSLDPYQQAFWSVAWAGETISLNWFDIAREYTEKWHHQMQIREALGKRDTLFSKKYVKPIYETFMKALPHVYRNVQTEKDSLISIKITGQCGGNWFLYNNQGNWELSSTEQGILKCEVEVEDNVAWKLFTNSIREDKESYFRVKGDRDLGIKIASMVTVMS